MFFMYEWTTDSQAFDATPRSNYQGMPRITHTRVFILSVSWQGDEETLIDYANDEGPKTKLENSNVINELMYTWATEVMRFIHSNMLALTLNTKRVEE